MIEAEPHGAWTVEEICRRAYSGAAVEKKHRVAVLRALFNTSLPAGWFIKYISISYRCGGVSGQTCCLYHGYDDESQVRAAFAEDRSRRDYSDFESWANSKYSKRTCDEARVRAAKCREIRDASPIRRIEIEIERNERMKIFLGAGDRQLVERIAELTAERDRLAAEQSPAIAAE